MSPTRPAFAASVTLQTGARVEKSFAPATITTGGTSTLTVTVRNFNTSPLTGTIAFNDPLPGTMRVAGPVATGGTCLPPMAFTPAPTAGDAFFTVSGGTLPGATIGVNSNANCTVTINVTATNAGPNPANLTNTIPVGNFGGVAYSSAGATLTVNATSSITASKAFAPNAVVQGGTSTLTVTINNSAAVAASLTAVFTDSLASMGAGYAVAASPAGSTTCGGVLTAVPGATSFSLPIGTTIPATGSCTITIPVQVAANAVTGARTNTVAQTVLQTTQGRTQAAITAVLTTTAALTVTKAYVPLTVAAGADSRLTVTLTHANGAPAFSGMAFTDNLPAGHTVSATPNVVSTCGGVVTAVSGTGSFSLAGGALGLGATSCTVAVNITSPASAGAVANTIPASTGVTTAEGFVNAAAASSTLTRVVTNVTLNKSFSPATVLVGGVSTLTINVLNTNANALALTTTGLVDTLPIGLAVAAAPLPSNTCGGALTAVAGAGTITLTGGSLAANATCTIQVHVVANASGNLIDTLGPGLFTSAQGVTNPLTASATLAATGSADMQVTKTDGVVNVVPGTSTTYTIVVKNNGPQPVAGAGVVDNPPAGMTFTGWTCVASAGSACGNASGSGPINELVVLLLNGTATYTVTAAIAPSATGTITNTVTVVVPGTVIDTNLANNTASDTDTLTPQADLAITKTDGVATRQRRRRDHVHDRRHQRRPVERRRRDLQGSGRRQPDRHIGHLRQPRRRCRVSDRAQHDDRADAGRRHRRADIAVGWQRHVHRQRHRPQRRHRQHHATSPRSPHRPASPIRRRATTRRPTPTRITLSADLAITKTDGVASVVPGHSTTYTIVVSNNGPSNVTGATVTDILPAAITSDTFTAVGSGGASGFTASRQRQHQRRRQPARRRDDHVHAWSPTSAQRHRHARQHGDGDAAGRRDRSDAGQQHARPTPTR